MKAAVLEARDRLISADAALPRLEPGDMLLRMGAAAICGTDIRIWRGRKIKGVRFPSILGHEFAGEIVEPAGHPGWRTGDRVTICPALPCGTCASCRAGASNICDALIAYGYEIDGGFAEFIRVPMAFVEARNVFRLADGLSFDLAALAEPLACVINGQSLMGDLEGKSVAVLGTGPIGLLHVMLARHRGASEVIAVQRSAHRREAALAVGADRAVTPDDAGDLSVDCAVVAVGAPELANLAAHIVRPRGRISLFAGFPVGVETPFDLNTVHYREQTVTGAFGLTRAQFEEALGLIAGGDLPVDRLISHRLDIEHALEAFALAEQGSALKVVVTNG